MRNDPARCRGCGTAPRPLDLRHLLESAPAAPESGAEMTAIYNWIKSLFAPVAPAVTDEHCPYCHGLGYDSSGFTCSCLREKK